MKTLIIAFTGVFLFAMCLASPLFVSSNEGQFRSPVGTCPSKNGENATYLPDSSNCAIFYECDSGTPHPKECMPGLCFDPTLNVCAFPEKDFEDVEFRSPVGTCPPRDTNKTVFLPDSANCSMYYICSNGRPILSVCAPDMSWNTEKETCDYDIDTNCNKGIDYFDYEFRDPVGSCPPRDTNETIFLTDSSNCSIYYICSNGRPIQSVCSPGMSWNTEKKTCDYDIDTNCKKTHEQDRPHADPFAAVGSCPPRDTNVTVFLPDSDSCKIYYICSNGRPIQASCPEGMNWNPEKNTCDWEIDAPCNKKPFDAPSFYTVVGECPAKDPEFPVFLPDSEDCQLYYECSGGVPFQNDCPADLEFNPVLMVCDDPLDAGCKAGNKTEIFEWEETDF